MFLQQEAERVKTEKDVGVESSFSTDPYKICIPSTFSIEKYEPEVSYVIFDDSYGGFGVVCLYSCACMHLCISAYVGFLR